MVFKGKRVIVMGGSRGIGRSIALGFATAGASVSICARSAGANPVRPHGLAGEDRQRRAVPGLPGGKLGHRANHRG